METVIIDLDEKKKYRNAFYFLSIERIIMEELEVDDYFNMCIYDKDIMITSDNKEIIDGLNSLLSEVEDEND
ncbi:MAG: hypothetical protein MR504_08395 [Methanobrevibacter woesei]|uniref:hypothetical protein n=1 Tax=Methanobrevibacter woesei TaxID=190976 RepID=UPI0023EF5F7B|nr:hypothetical protein [Methanobrevibacter woesei]MCI7292197.1 hypothetical protein [Methanobrevibacter woesei]